MLVKRFPRLSETFVLNEILELRRQGIPLRLYSIMDPKESCVQPEAAALCGEVRYLRAGDSFAAWAPLLGDVPWALRRYPAGFLRAQRLALSRCSVATWKHFVEAAHLVRAMVESGSRHVHAHFAHGPAAVAHLAHLFSGASFSFTAHAKDLFTTPPEYVAERSRRARFVITCTESNRAYLESLGADVGAKVTVLPHGVDLSRFGAIQRRPVPGRILSVGRFIPKKGFDVLLRALEILKRRHIPFECRILGGGRLWDELAEQARALGIADQVVLGGARQQAELLEQLAEAEVFALAPVVMADGDRDGAPNVLIEAMAAGVPVVSTAISGIPELIRHEDSGLLVPPGKPEALAAAIRRVLTDAGLRRRLGEAGRTWVVEGRDLRTSVVPLATMFRGVLQASAVGGGA